MNRILTTASALAIIAVMTAGVARADQPQQAVAPQATQVAALPQGQAIPSPRWHYEWQYTFDKFNQLHPGWVAVQNRVAQ